ncbi:Glycine receptor subunit alphaZ1 [Orchesella cincta]|uniref:Glycine receptor subunit alphaZ1 n=1 Tax=Orchesella cincta TaxID=48709 RepID=A0A1D2M533_ORCCI|nr:Glycine receptor subunit alphaZ1 [Orchesella cincta]
MFASVRESTPIVSYVKAIDTWMVFCIFFVFLTLLEFSIFVWLRARREDAEEQKLDHQRKLQEKREPGHKDPDSSFVRSPSLESIRLRKFERFAEFTEKFAFIIFSVVFTSFNVIYWTWLLVASDYFNWSVNETLNADLD